MRVRRAPVLNGQPIRRARPRKLEDIEQARLAFWLDNRRLGGEPLLWAHVPNGGARHPAVARQLRAAGVKPGVPDVLIFDSPPSTQVDVEGSAMQLQRYVGVAIELKRPKGGRASDKQQQWLKQLAVRGWLVMVAHGADEAIRALERLGY